MMPEAARVPRRALIVSANIGEGHDSAGRALAEAAGRAWPGCATGWLDALEAVGPRFARMARRYYVAQVRSMPATYEFFFAAMWRHRWYLEATRRGAGSLFGRRMAPHIRAFAPDVVLSTYPLGSAGLSWLRRRGQLPVPVGAWVPAFSPHPSWLYRNLDRTYVMHEAAVRVAEQAEPGVAASAGALPVRDGFRPVSPAARAATRARLDLPAESFTVLVSTGSFAFGEVAHAVAAVLRAGPAVHVLVVCGRNQPLRRQLTSGTRPGGRLHVVGWTDDMPAMMAAADAVVTNGGGTTLEAIAAARPVVITDPVAGHGRANARLLGDTGLALLAPDPESLTATVRRLAGDPGQLAAQAMKSLNHTTGRCREDDLADLAGAAAP
jgi:UDP-N-acetylglucosamine:LPS N-acetylglucosamine transferase